MPFLLPLVPALIGGAASAAAGAGVNAIGRAISGTDDKATPQKANLGTTSFGTAPINSVNLAQPVTANNAANSLNQSQGAVDQQQALIGALQGQNGIQNQSDVYNQQQALAGQLGLMASGQGGPNVADKQLANATGANVANQAALMAGQRGAGANAGLIARQAGQQGSAAQQQLAGQASSLRAQEQLNAIGALQNQQGMLGNTATQQVGQQTGAIGNLNQYSQGQQNALLSALASQNSQNLNQQQNINALNLQQQQGLNQSNLAQQQGINQLNVSQAQGANNINSNMAQQQNQQNFALGNALSGGVGSSIAAGVNGMFGGTAQAAPATSPASKGFAASPTFNAGPNPVTGFAQGGEVPNLKENYKGKSKVGGHLMQDGGVVPGKPKVAGKKDTLKNDTVAAKLSPGEIVLPRSVTQSKDPAAAAARFVAALKSKKGK